MRHARTHRRGRGFTLVEAVATMTVLAVVSIAASRIIFAAADAYIGAASSSHLSSEASAAMERIASELRGVPSRAGSPGTPWIDSVTATSVAWGGTSSLARSGSVVMLTIDGGTPRTLLSNVTGFSIACYDQNGQAMAQTLSGAACDAVRRIEITLTLSRSGASETLRTRIFPRAALAGVAGGAP
ncbi:MAG: prepilin-type N-terminal cleavage/methylation domain-containing protein [Phycisphaeraceae bacterium]|nr:prepilin-type N-terminal cleavage/methylation domain-containing protein [Phycisphaeraceae bacterium]